MQTLCRLAMRTTDRPLPLGYNICSHVSSLARTSPKFRTTSHPKPWRLPLRVLTAVHFRLGRNFKGTFGPSSVGCATLEVKKQNKTGLKVVWPLGEKRHENSKLQIHCRVASQQLKLRNIPKCCIPQSSRYRLMPDEVTAHQQHSQ
jgi:hypothetical protein